MKYQNRVNNGYLTSDALVQKHYDKNVRLLAEREAVYIEMMAAAYLKETDIPASEVELVRVDEFTEGRTFRYFFRRRQSGEHDG